METPVTDDTDNQTPPPSPDPLAGTGAIFLTPQERDELRLAIAPLVLAAIQPRDFIPAESPAQRATENARRMLRALYAANEADALIAELETRLEIVRFPDGQPIDPRAMNTSARFCAHGVAMDQDCALCADADLKGAPSHSSDLGPDAGAETFPAPFTTDETNRAAIADATNHGEIDR